MKRSFYLLLCVMLVLSALTACLAPMEEHTHEYDTSKWVSNTVMHWYAASCEHTEERASVGLHTDANNDGTCDVCAYGSDHVHTYEEGWAYDAENHWHAVSCGHTVDVADKAAHVDANNDKLCDVCSYDYNHTHTYSTAWNSDATSHWHDANCGCTIPAAEKEDHIDRDNDGVCEVCLGNTYEEGHTHTYSSTWKYDVQSHWQVGACHTGVISAPAAHGDTDRNGVCDTCGFDYLHEHTYSADWSGDTAYHWHAASCGHVIDVVDKAAHTDANKDGKCDVCELTTYESSHTHTYEEAFTSDANGHWHKANCDHTGAISAVEAHTGMAGDGVCDTCGWSDTTHTHSYSPTWTYSETQHWQIATCGHSDLKQGLADHVDADSDKVCDTCGYDYGHIHTYSPEWTTDENKHWHAANCGCDVKAVEQDHVDEDKDGVCEVCAANTYAEDHEHTYATVYSVDLENHWYEVTCAHTGIVNVTVEAHTDDDEDGICDVCEGKTYAEDHEHVYDLVYSSDINGHWYACSCHPGVEVTVEAHTDEAKDGICDVCNNVIDKDHEHVMELVSTDASEHTYACADHPGYTVVGAHYGMEDGVCDKCEYTDLTDHECTHATEWSYDINAHWYAATCSHTALVELLAHVDEDLDGKCDDCGVETLENVIADITSDAAKDSVISGIYIDTAGETVYYEFGDNYYHVINGTWEYWYTLVDGEIFALVDYGYGEGYQPVSMAEAAMMNGPEVYLHWAVASGYGVENTISAMWNEALMNGGYEMTSEGNSYSFTYFYNYYDYYLYAITVSFELSEYNEQRYVSSASFDLVAYYYDSSAKVTNFRGEETYDVSVLELNSDASESLTIQAQRAGNSTASFPFDVEDFLVTSYDLMNGEEVVTENTVVSVPKGDYNGAALYYANVESKVGGFNFDAFVVTVTDAEGVENTNIEVSDYGDYLRVYASGSAAAGTYTVTVKTALVTKTFKIEVEVPAVNSFETAVLTDDGKTVVSEYSVFVGDSIQVMSKVNSYADASYSIAITSDNAADATIVVPDSTAAEGEWNYYFGNASTITFNAAGEYTVVLTSLADSTYTATLTVTVSEPPTIEELLSGNYAAVDQYMSGQAVYVTFTPDSEGATSGAAVINVVDYYSNALVATYNLKYSYDETTGISLTDADGVAFTDMTMVYENNAITVSWSYEGWWGPEYTSSALVASEPYSPPSALDLVAGDYFDSLPAYYATMGLNIYDDNTAQLMTNPYGWENEVFWFTWEAAENGDGTVALTLTADESYNSMIEGYGAVIYSNISSCTATVSGDTVTLTLLDGTLLVLTKA